MKKQSVLAVLLSAVALMGCASFGGKASPDLLQKLTTGAVPCAQQDIKIIDDKGASGFNIWTWTAECDGETYFCSRGTNAETQCMKKSPK